MIPLLWDKKTVSHCVLEITQQCNLACEACCREKTDHFRSLEEIRQDLITLERADYFTESFRTATRFNGVPA